MNRLINGLSIFSLATLLALGGFVGFLFGSGKLNTVRLERIAAVLRGELDPNQDPNAVGHDVAATQPATEGVRRTSAEEARVRRHREELESLRLDRAKADLEAQRRLLDQVLQQVLQNQEKLAADKAAMDKQAKTARQKAKSGVPEDEGFRHEVELVRNMKPDKAKDYLLRLWRKQKADAVRLFAALDTRQSSKILEQFQTEEELQIMADLLEQVRNQSQEGNAAASRRTAGAATP